MSQAMTREKALLYRLDAGTEKGDGVRRVLRGMNVGIADLTPDLLGQTVGACAGLNGFRRTDDRYEGPAPTDDVLIMAGFSDNRINQLLSQLKAAGVPRIDLMATVTEHNRTWTLLDLFRELASERRIMGAWISLQQAVKAADAHVARAATHLGPDFDEVLTAARTILDSEEPPQFEAISQADAALRAFLPGLNQKPR